MRRNNMGGRSELACLSVLAWQGGPPDHSLRAGSCVAFSVRRRQICCEVGASAKGLVYFRQRFDGHQKSHGSTFLWCGRELVWGQVCLLLSPGGRELSCYQGGRAAECLSCFKPSMVFPGIPSDLSFTGNSPSIVMLGAFTVRASVYCAVS